jgi:hypothetical protein
MPTHYLAIINSFCRVNKKAPLRVILEFAGLSIEELPFTGQPAEKLIQIQKNEAC